VDPFHEATVVETRPPEKALAACLTAL